MKKIGDQTEALQISKRSVQTACLYLNGLKSYSTLNEIVPFESFLKHVPRILMLKIKNKKNILLVGRSWYNFYCSRTKVWKLSTSNFSTPGRQEVCFSYFFLCVCVFRLNLAHLSGGLVCHYFKVPHQALQITSLTNGGHNLARRSSHQ